MIDAERAISPQRWRIERLRALDADVSDAEALLGTFLQTPVAMQQHLGSRVAPWRMIRQPAHLASQMTWLRSLRASKAREELLATVLVVDDNRDSALAIAQLLELSGHSAIAAFSAREALDVLDERSIDIVLSDIRMPDVDGFDLLRVLRHRFPALPIILMSGLPITSDDVVPQGASVLAKPFTIEDLQGLLQQKLPQRAAT